MCVLRRELTVPATIFPSGEVVQVPRYLPGKGVELAAGGSLRGLVVLAGRPGIRDQPLLLRFPRPRNSCARALP